MHLQRLRVLVPHGIALLLYTLLACCATWPLVGHLTTHLPAVPNELSQDLWQNIWNVWWVRQALLVHHTNLYTTHVLFYPLGTSLYLHTLNLPLALVGVPLLAIWEIVPTYNVLTLLVLVLAGYSTFLLARHITSTGAGAGAGPGHAAAALVAGTIVLLAPQRLNELRLAQLPTISDYGVPLALLGVLLALRHGTWRMALLAGGGVLLAGLSSWYHLFHLGIILLVVLVWQVVVAKDEFDARAWGRVAGASTLLVAPFLLPALVEAVTAPYAQKSSELVSRADIVQLVPQTLAGSLQPVPPDWTSTSLFGLIPLLLALFALVRVPRQVGVWAAVAVVGVVLMAGPVLTVGGVETGIPLPYALVRELPVVGVFRAPLRLNAVVTLAIGIMAAVGVANLLNHVSPRTVWPLAGGLIVLMTLEAVRLPFPLISGAVSPFYERIAGTPGEWSVLELPIDRSDRLLLEMYAQTHHGGYILTGQTSRSVPRLPYESAPPIAQVERADARPDIVTMTPAERDQLLRGLRTRYLVIHDDPQQPGRAEHQIAVARRTLGPLTQVYAGEQMHAYRLDDVAQWLDGAGAAITVDLPLFLGLDMRWEPPEVTRHGLARWLPAEGAGLWAYTSRPRQVALALTLYSLPGARPLDIWLNGEHVQTVPIPAGLEPHRSVVGPLSLPAGPNLLELRAPQGGASPHALGLGDDTRLLSFSIHHVELHELTSDE